MSEHPGGEQSIAETQRLAASAYLLLTTYRKDGRAVPPAVWASTDGTRLYVWTQADAGKVKRVRNRGHVQVAPCDARGALQGRRVVAQPPEKLRAFSRVLVAERRRRSLDREFVKPAENP